MTKGPRSPWYENPNASRSRALGSSPDQSPETVGPEVLRELRKITQPGSIILSELSGLPITKRTNPFIREYFASYNDAAGTYTIVEFTIPEGKALHLTEIRFHFRINDPTTYLYYALEDWNMANWFYSVFKVGGKVIFDQGFTDNADASTDPPLYTGTQRLNVNVLGERGNTPLHLIVPENQRLAFEYTGIGGGPAFASGFPLIGVTLKGRWLSQADYDKLAAEAAGR